MAIEIERKFLVTGTAWKSENAKWYSQGYLCTRPERTVRVRVTGEAAWLTIKGLSSGASRTEFEYPIPIEDAEQMLAICEQPPVEKHRHIVLFAGKRWEVDEFTGANQGLVVAEIELNTEDEVFDRPPWLGKEVTDEHRYYNSHLARQPFCTWPESSKAS